MPFESISYVHYWPMLAYAASSVHVMKMCQAFQQIGYTTHLYAPDEPDQRPELSQIWMHFGITDQFYLHLIRPLPHLRKHDIALRAAWRIRSKTRTLAYGRNLAAMMWTSLLGVPTALEIHDAPTPQQMRYLRWMLRGRGFRRLVVISQPLKALYQEALSLADEQIIIEPDAVDIERFESLPTPQDARQQLGLDEQRFTATYAGSLYDGRGIEIIMELAARLPDVQFVVVGGDPQQVEGRQQQVRDRQLENLKLIGFVPNPRIPLYLAASDALLMPYQRKVRVFNNEGDIANWISPMKMFEYMAAQRPIISSDLPVLREVLNDQNAIMIPPDDADAWQGSLVHLRDDSLFGANLARQACADVQHFTWKKRAARLLEQILQER